MWMSCGNIIISPFTGDVRNNNLKYPYMILFHVPAPRIRATRRYQQKYAINPTIATNINTKIDIIIILYTLLANISVITCKKLWHGYITILLFMAGVKFIF